MMFLNDGFMRLLWNDVESVGGYAGLCDDRKMGKAYPNYNIEWDLPENARGNSHATLISNFVINAWMCIENILKI